MLLCVALLQDMIVECQELLGLFGLPFLVAPGEAEAQCAWLESAGLVEGVVTDDNDAFLFGAQHVYRHLFEDKRLVAGEGCEQCSGWHQILWHAGSEIRMAWASWMMTWKQCVWQSGC